MSAKTVIMVKKVHAYRHSWYSAPYAQSLPYTSSCGSLWNQTSTLMPYVNDAMRAQPTLKTSAATAIALVNGVLALGKKHRCLRMRNPQRKYGMCTVDRWMERNRPIVVYPTRTPRQT